MTESEFRRHGWRLLAAWAVLIVLMLASLGSAYVPLGRGNVAVGLAIALAKAGIVAALFMGLARAPALLRVVGCFALGTLLLLIGLSGIDYATRAVAPAPFQGSLR
ncbi:MAG TPA: cytochrome C oxidase subunit IV family protein [Ramlibacter sp.]|uniref:cytochrome C oxidase subunit IV family protein n=1 Tax=Ramlibacter sp. TaxID=1917967 RepID=UPI002D7E1C69|nr:cytochrome C oxidase subunit IV family protein [Ramlibacter sp.]HET8749074.1 cytochrome C oxidase subunit IV family protein [Ramlibacter sp.]